MECQLAGRCYFPMRLGPFVVVERRGIHIGLLAQSFDDQSGLRSDPLVRRSLRCSVCRCIVFLDWRWDCSFSYVVGWGSFFGSKKCCRLLSFSLAIRSVTKLMELPESIINQYTLMPNCFSGFIPHFPLFFYE